MKDMNLDNRSAIYYLALNQKVEALANPKVQEAMRWAVDYTGMADTILKGQWGVHQAFLPKGFLGALEDTPYSLDLEKAKAALAESGVTLPLEVSLTVRNNPERLDIAQSIQNTFGQIGINLPFLAEPWKPTPPIVPASTIILMIIILLVLPQGLFGRKE